ncbi:MAG: DUF305 domain-containing protein [Chloroflexota bacterium]|nr:DUF305 domain-containing protein [Chloroflexota bacterium]
MQRGSVLRRVSALALTVTVGFGVSVGAGSAADARFALQELTPEQAYSCANLAMSSTPTGSMNGMNTGTPMAGIAGETTAEDVEIDQLYIDMMIPHHLSITAMAEAALPLLEDERLREIAQTITDTQTTEVSELRDLRGQFYGSPDPVPLDADMMMRLMPNMSMDMQEMMSQMDPESQVAQFCAAADPDLAFIDMTIPHHQSAIEASEVAAEQAIHPEITEFAQHVIEDQQAEIDELMTIRQELYGPATPES